MAFVEQGGNLIRQQGADGTIPLRRQGFQGAALFGGELECQVYKLGFHHYIIRHIT